MLHPKGIKDQQYFSDLNQFKGKKLLITDTRKIKLLKASHRCIRPQLNINLFDLKPEELANTPENTFKTLYQDMPKSEQLGDMTRRNHDTLRKKARPTVAPLKMKSLNRNQALWSSLQKNYESERVLNKPTEDIHNRESQNIVQTVREREKNKYCRNPFFKAFKLKVHLRNKSKSGRETPRLSEKDIRSFSAMSQRNPLLKHCPRDVCTAPAHRVSRPLLKKL